MKSHNLVRGKFRQNENLTQIEHLCYFLLSSRNVNYCNSAPLLTLPTESNKSNKQHSLIFTLYFFSFLSTSLDTGKIFLLDSYETLGTLHYLPGTQFFLYKIGLKNVVCNLQNCWYYRNYMDKCIWKSISSTTSKWLFEWR